MTGPIAALLSACLALPLVPGALHAGPPWVSIELPANPLNPTTRGMFLLVRSYHHGDVMQYPLTGTATGLVRGRKQTLTLTFDRTNVPGVMALRKSWPSEGAWVLSINIGGKEGPTALVGIGADGKVRSVDVPTQTRDGHTFGREVTGKDIDDALREVAAIPERQAEHAGAAGLALIVPAALVLALRRRRAPAVS